MFTYNCCCSYHQQFVSVIKVEGKVVCLQVKYPCITNIPGLGEVGRCPGISVWESGRGLPTRKGRDKHVNTYIYNSKLVRINVLEIYISKVVMYS